MPNVTAVVPTPNPLANKFMIDAPMFSGAPRHFASPKHAMGDALGESLLGVPGVTEAYCTAEFITVTRHHATDWDMIESRVIECIETYKPKRVIGIAREDGAPAAAAAPAAAPAEEAAPIEVETDDPEMLMRVNMILDENIRPFLDKDGGGIDVLRLQDFTLTVRYKGACGGCPSAVTGTLFAISNLLQNYVDDRLQVVLD
ncbi:NifU family protein [Thauera aromatica]|uniref:NifU-like protein n=1 Tax=Thauera aromatica K172 TaxID=44139 RepID=A0A2R4BLQ9_THAAR|nr:NifU N-terminal domain-containing protein [Thauera aromatica]AVR88202.1 NifU-like protein [Thauera aromatica K172]MCK2095021.1 NifU N-terminal domain-containing protein [Thauera aromatica]